MRTRLSSSAFALIAAVGWAAPASAQDNAAVAEELAKMRAQMAAMANRIDTLEAQLAAARTQADAATATATEAAAGVAAAAEAAEREPATSIAWKGAPVIEGAGGWSFKPRGRLQVDAGVLSAPDGIADGGTGFGSEVRRAYLGFDGKIPGGFGYRAEIDVASSNVEITDLYLTYDVSDALGLTIGQHKPFWGLEEMTSDLFTSFTERAAVNTAFGFERRLGASASWAAGDVLVQGGVFSDNVADLNDDGNNAYSIDGRAVFMPKLAGGQFHLGGSVHHRDLNDAASGVRYRARPFIHTPDIRFVDTGVIPAAGETGYGVETAFISGPFHATGEARWQRVDRSDALKDPTFFGGYAEVGMFLTGGDTRGYKGGTFDRTRPKNPIDKGGFGAVQVNLRYDYLDLRDGGIAGGQQSIYAVGLIWTLTDYVRMMANYGHAVYDDAAIAAAGGDRSDSADAFGLRAQIDF